MMSNRLFFKDELKRFIWIGLLALFILSFSQIIIPSLEILDYTQNVEVMTDYMLRNIYQVLVSNIFTTIAIIGLAFAGQNVFSYLHSKDQIDFYHSLPIKREKLFLIKYSIVPIMVIPIIIIIYLLSYFIAQFAFKIDIVSFAQILKAIGINIIFFLSLYSIVVFSNIISGSKIIATALGLILSNINGIIAIIVVILNRIYSRVIVLEQFWNNQFLYSPFTSLFIQNINDPDNIILDKIFYTSLIINILIFIIVTILNLYLFKIRKSENNRTIAFKPIEIILKYLGVILGSLYLGTFFAVISNNEFLIYIGAIFGAVVFYCMANVILNSDFKAMFKNWYGIIVCSIISLFIIVCFNFDIFKIKNYIPEENKIESVVVYNLPTTFNNIELKEQNNISYILQMHKQTLEENNFRGIVSKVSYNMKNGKIVERMIHLDPVVTEKILKSNEFKEEATSFFYKDLDLEYLDINIETKENNINIDENSKKKEILDAIRKDLEVNSVYSDKDILFKVEIYYQSYIENSYYKRLTIDITKDFKNTLSIFDKYQIKTDNIDFSKAERVEFYINDEKYVININDSNRDKVISIIDNGQLLKTNLGTDYMIYIFFKDNEVINNSVSTEAIEILKNIK